MVSTTMYSSKKHISTPYSVNKTKTMLTKNNGACVCCPLAWKGAGASTRALMMLDLCTAKVILHKFCCELSTYISSINNMHIWAGTKLRFQSLSKKTICLFLLIESNLNTTQNSFRTLNCPTGQNQPKFHICFIKRAQCRTLLKGLYWCLATLHIHVQWG